MRPALRLLAVAALLAISSAVTSPLRAEGVEAMTGCWISEDFAPTSLLSDTADPDTAEVVIEKMLLRFEKIDGTDHLVFGRIYEWDKANSYVLGPTYQNGAYNPAGGFLTFGFPMGGLDHVTQPAPDRLLYVHTKSSSKSAMSVRLLLRIDCSEADRLENDLLQRQRRLG